MIKVSVGNRAPIPVRVRNGAGTSVSVPPTRVIALEAERYAGPYEVTPKLEPQTMQTKDKLMVDDVIVNSVPIYKTKNFTGGYTVYVARKVDE